MTQLSNVYGASPINNQITFIYGHNRHFDNRTLIHIEHQNTQLFVIKSGDYVNTQLDDNGSSEKLKFHYIHSK